jgi:hypothetical protein
MRKSFWIFAVCAALTCAASAFAAESDAKYAQYTDKKFGYSIEYPDIFGDKNEYTDGDGLNNLELTTESNAYTLTLVGGKAPKGATGASLLKERTNMEEDDNGYVNGSEPLPGTAKSGNGFYTLEYETDEGYLCHEYGLLDKKVKAVFTLRIKKDAIDEDIFREVCAAVEKSFKLKK